MATSVAREPITDHGRRAAPGTFLDVEQRQPDQIADVLRPLDHLYEAGLGQRAMEAE